MTTNRKPHLLSVKTEIINIIDDRINTMKTLLEMQEASSGEQDFNLRRSIAIWIKQRNRIAKDAGLEVIPLNTKTLQGSLIYMD